MGGIGSGNHGRQSPRWRVEDVLRLRAGHLLGSGRRASEARLRGALSWSSRFGSGVSEIQMTVGPGSVELSYVISDSGDRRAERVAISSVPQPFGGVRWRFHCPRCGGACRALYRPPRHWERFACRTCHRLSYTSQALAMPERWRHRAENLYRRAGTSSNADYHYKPKRMRWSTFDRLIDEAQEWDDASIGYGLMRLLGRLGSTA